MQEIQAAKLQDGEPAELDAERRRLANAEQLAQLSAEALQLLQESDGERLAVLDAIGSIEQALSRLARIDPGVAPLAEQLEQAGALLDDLARELGRYGEEIEFNPRRLAQVEERLHLIHTLQRKYGDTIADVLAYGERAAAELETISHAGERIEELEAEEADLLAQLGRLGAALSAARREAGERIGPRHRGRAGRSPDGARAFRRADRAGRPTRTARSWTPNPRPRPANSPAATRSTATGWTRSLSSSQPTPASRCGRWRRSRPAAKPRG